MASAPTPPVYQTELFLDNAIYNPGDLVNGTITFKLDRKLHCDRVIAQLYGSARVFFVQKYTAPGSLMKTKAFEQEQVLVDQTQDLWITNNAHLEPKELSLNEIARRASSTAIRLPRDQEVNRPGLEGTQTFGFSFPLPERGLHTSFDAQNAAGYVRYYILIKAFNGSVVVLRKKLLFAVVVPRVLENQPLAQEERMFAGRKEYSKNSYLAVECRLEKRVFVPGEPIRGEIFIDNQSGKSVKYANLHIVQDTVCYSLQPEVQMHESSFKTAGMGLPCHKVPTGNQHKYPIAFNIPALVPSIDVPHCLHTDYRLQLDVNYVRGSPKGAPISIKIPIAIGTHLSETPFAPAIAPRDLRHLPSAPPAYDSRGMLEAPSDLPPAYSAVLTGLSAVDSDVPGYLPLVYHYNFGFDLNDEAGEVEKKTQ